ncbi:MAG: transporter substrate-binding domain-containing protein [Alysiella sp.]|uniref:substrate-binding periplasmic protein n=1 Tax=Alysiella sp. TaxID=1872483 RepID=UPI0026DB7107|nr:transporter substrate-binding domain-containing protein [Alysiella sp.]MDO4434179.1 transporter substrate-binding domain-containing protein [Alysiella sp.]
MASQLTYPPFHYIGNNGEPDGFEVALLQEVAKAGEFNITIQNTPRTLLEETLNNDRVQIWSSTISINPERATQMDFSQSFMHKDSRAIVLQDNEANQSLQKAKDFKGKKIAINELSKGDREAAMNLADSKNNLVVTPSYITSIGSMLTGETDAVLDNGLVLRNYLKKQKDLPSMRMILPSEENKDYAFAVKKGNAELLNKINQGLEKVKADGTYQKLVEQWFGDEKI